MTPQYLNELADVADPDELWRLDPFKQLDLPADKRKQLDAGVALRRYAGHMGRLLRAFAQVESLLITPLSPNCTATKFVSSPPEHRKLRATRK
jgi:hypothetical protein